MIVFICFWSPGLWSSVVFLTVFFKGSCLQPGILATAFFKLDKEIDKFSHENSFPGAYASSRATNNLKQTNKQTKKVNERKPRNLVQQN